MGTGIERSLAFIGGANSAFTCLTGAATAHVVAQYFGGPLMVILGVAHAFFAMGQKDCLIRQGLARRPEFVGCVCEHLFEFSST
jgi:hypothetical protein